MMLAAPVIEPQIISHFKFKNPTPNPINNRRGFRFRFHHVHHHPYFRIIGARNPIDFVLNSTTFPSRTSQLSLWRQDSQWLRRRRIVATANSSCEQETETETDLKSKAAVAEKKKKKAEAKSEESKRNEKERKGWFRGDRKWRWQPNIRGQDFNALMLQLLFMFFILRLPRPGVMLPWIDNMSPTVYVTVPYSEFLGKINGNQVEEVEVDGNHLRFKLKEREVNAKESEVGSSGGSTTSQDLDFLLLKSMKPTKRIVYSTIRPADIRTPYEKMLENDVVFGSPEKRSGGFFVNSALMGVICVAFLVGLIQKLEVSFFPQTGQLRNRKSGNSRGAKVPEQGETVTFADVAGVDEAKEELEEIVDFLKNPDRYLRLGARPPRGVLLVGRPGTGKTLLAKAVAGEADVPFISCSGSEFVELFVGMGASRIDAVAKSRDGKFRIVSNDEREQTLNQLLTEMDGFDSNSAVIVLGATNRADVLDPALRRPGRFDRVVAVEAPDRMGREAILKVHASKKELPLGDDVNLADIASMTTGFTGADLANLVNEAALLAGRENKTVVGKIDFIHAVERSVAGIEKKTAKLKGNEKAVVARHEAGHAVVGTAVANLLPGQPRVEKLSILPRSGGALGFTYIPPTHEDRYLLFIDELRGRLVTLLGGRAAEEVIYAGRVSTGALDDIRRATDMAYKAVAEYGLNQTVGPVSLSTLSGGGMDESGASPWGKDQGQLVDLVQREVKALLQSAMEVALCVIRANPTVLEGLGAQLEDKEKVEGEELQKWLKLVVAPAELAIFIRDCQESLLPAPAAEVEIPAAAVAAI
ncbi:ATP-dependent zinc metalloprotease FTSH 7, chloroplastic-like protein [Drosera capensis]